MPPTSELRTATAHLKTAMARLIRKGVWHSDAHEILSIVFPNYVIPPNWEHEWYDDVRGMNALEIIPIPNYKPIW